jgi:hypothetical protein
MPRQAKGEKQQRQSGLTISWTCLRSSGSNRRGGTTCDGYGKRDEKEKETKRRGSREQVEFTVELAAAAVRSRDTPPHPTRRVSTSLVICFYELQSLCLNLSFVSHNPHAIAITQTATAQHLRGRYRNASHRYGEGS